MGKLLGRDAREERAANQAAFASIVARDQEEKALLKSVSELHLVLPR
jgi:hypothetical protein